MSYEYYVSRSHRFPDYRTLPLYIHPSSSYTFIIFFYAITKNLKYHKKILQKVRSVPNKRLYALSYLPISSLSSINVNQILSCRYMNPSYLSNSEIQKLNIMSTQSFVARQTTKRYKFFYKFTYDVLHVPPIQLFGRD